VQVDTNIKIGMLKMKKYYLKQDHGPRQNQGSRHGSGQHADRSSFFNARLDTELAWQAAVFIFLHNDKPALL